jgi:hypothetical protein
LGLPDCPPLAKSTLVALPRRGFQDTVGAVTRISVNGSPSRHPEDHQPAAPDNSPPSTHNDGGHEIKPFGELPHLECFRPKKEPRNAGLFTLTLTSLGKTPDQRGQSAGPSGAPGSREAPGIGETEPIRRPRLYRIAHIARFLSLRKTPSEVSNFAQTWCRQSVQAAQLTRKDSMPVNDTHQRRRPD